MFLVVSLVLEYQENEKVVSLVVSEDRVFDLNECRIRNNGINRNQNFRIFYSANDLMAPNFKLPLRNRFVANEDSCYIGRLVLFHGKNFFFTIFYILV